MVIKAIKFGFNLIIYHPRGWFNFIINQKAAMLKISYVPALPVHITIEPTNFCNLRCPVCETGCRILERPQGFMSLDNFKKIIDKIYKHTNTLMFYFMGEPFLNKDAYEMIKYAKAKNIFVEACTNGDFVDGRKLIDSGIDKISFQIGGTAQETHQIYRVNSNLEKILNNIKEAIKRKKETDAKTEIILGFIIMKHNERQISDFWKLAKDLEIKGEIISPCVRDEGQGKLFLPEDERYWIYDKKAFEKGILKPKNPLKNSCWWIWHSLVITWDGNVVPCCRDPRANYIMGNILNENLKDIWNNKRYRTFRKQILTNQKNIPICQLCNGFGLPHLK